MRLLAYIVVGWVALSVVFVWAWSRMKHWELDEPETMWDVLELPEPDPLDTVRPFRAGPKGFQKQPKDAL